MNSIHPVNIELNQFLKLMNAPTVGDHIAQIIIQRCESPVFAHVDSLDETERGIGGFGHTGLSQEVQHVTV